MYDYWLYFKTIIIYFYSCPVRLFVLYDQKNLTKWKHNFTFSMSLFIKKWKYIFFSADPCREERKRIFFLRWISFASASTSIIFASIFTSQPLNTTTYDLLIYWLTNCPPKHLSAAVYLYIYLRRCIFIIWKEVWG